MLVSYIEKKEKLSKMLIVCDLSLINYFDN